MITATNPTTIQPAAAPAVYNFWWISQFTVTANDNSAAVVNVSLRKYRYLDQAQTQMEFSPIDPVLNVQVPNALNSTDPNVQSVMGAILAGVQAYGTANGLL